MKVTVDPVVFAYIDKKLHVLLIKRTFKPFHGQWALPGGFVNEDESADKSVVRKLDEETNVNLNYLEQLYTFTEVNRDPRERIISIAYYALINPTNQNLIVNVHAEAVQWFPLKELKNLELAFDHTSIIDYAIRRLRNKVTYEPIGFELLPKQFTMTDLYDLYVAINGTEIDRRNFIRKINGFELLKKTTTKTKGNVGRRAQLFEFDKKRYDEFLKKGFIFDI